VSTGPFRQDSGAADLTLSPAGRLLYVVRRIDISDPSGCAALYTHGTLSAVDVAQAERYPTVAVRASCCSVRVGLSGAGDVAWVTAQVVDHVLAFRSSAIVTDLGHALAASVQVDRAPTGLALVEDGAVVASRAPTATWRRTPH